MRDRKITLEDYMNNNGYSSKQFIEHFKYFLERMPEWLELTLYRRKAVILNAKTKKDIVLRVHWHGKTDKYITILRGNVEMATLRNDISPQVLRDVILSCL